MTIATQADARAEVWIAAGFAELARSGVEGVRVEVLAKNLGVTKGGFYRRFRDRAALLQAMLESWSTGRIASIAAQTSLDGVTARERLRALIKLYSERMNTDAMAIELAIRQWARTDELDVGDVDLADGTATRIRRIRIDAGIHGFQLDRQAALVVDGDLPLQDVCRIHVPARLPPLRKASFQPSRAASPALRAGPRQADAR